MVDKSKAGPVEETVSLSKNEFTALMKRIEHLENSGIAQKLQRVKEHVGHLRVWDDQLVIGIGSERLNYDLPENHSQRSLIDITVVTADGEKVKKTVNFPNFFTHAVKVPVKFLSIKKHEHAEVEPSKGGGGYGNKRLVDSQGRSSDYLTAETLALEVGYIDVAAEIEVLEGAYKGQKFAFENHEISAINA